MQVAVLEYDSNGQLGFTCVFDAKSIEFKKAEKEAREKVKKLRSKSGMIYKVYRLELFAAFRLGPTRISRIKKL